MVDLPPLPLDSADHLRSFFTCLSHSGAPEMTLNEPDWVNGRKNVERRL